MKELRLLKCLKCGSLVEELVPCNCKDCGIICCNEPMKEVRANSSDGAFEKHIPEYEIVNDEIIVKVNHVMESDHYIEWICFVTNNTKEYVYFKPGDTPSTKIKNKKGIIYSYCNKHGLWKVEV